MPIDTRFLPVPCDHESDGVPADREIPDHHPVTPGDIRNLFTACMEGIATGGVSSIEAAKMQMRLTQAVLGAVCPHSIDDENEARSKLVNWLFVEATKRVREWNNRREWNDRAEPFPFLACYCDAIIGIIHPQN